MSAPVKILVAYATAGIGHKKAAMAVEEALKAIGNGFEVKTIDVLDYTNPFFKKNYPSVYLFLISRMIHVWGLLYYFFDIPFVHRLAAPLRRLYHAANARGLLRFLEEYRPDVVVSTHFLLPDVAIEAKKKIPGMKVINVVTDYRAHAFWISGGVDAYVAAHENTKADLVGKWLIDPDAVKIIGIPVEPKFSKDHDRRLTRVHLNIPDTDFTVLLLSGGFGVGPIYETIKLLEPLKDRLSVIAVCGHNKKLYERVEALKKELGAMRVINLGYVNTIDELMAASDLYVGKAGGISIAESLAMGLPLVFVRPIPGQESRNADFVLARKAGMKVAHFRQIFGIVKELKEGPEKLKVLKTNVEAISKKRAAAAIAEFVISYGGIKT